MLLTTSVNIQKIANQKIIDSVAERKYFVTNVHKYRRKINVNWNKILNKKCSYFSK